MHDPEKLRELATWYRELAERAGNPATWVSHLRMAEDHEAEQAANDGARKIGGRDRLSTGPDGAPIGRMGACRRPQRSATPQRRRPRQPAPN